MACAGTATAQASGDAGIASAAVVTYGQQYFGNTATDSSAPDCGTHYSWWLLPVVAGDEVDIDFEGTGVKYEETWPIGTTDFNVRSTEDLQQAPISNNGKQEAVVEITTSGNLPLAFLASDCDSSFIPGPYDFTATVLHGVKLGIPVLVAPAQAGTVTVGVHNPDGLALSGPSLSITLQVESADADSDAWVNVGSGQPANGTATFSYAIPSTYVGKKIQVRAVSTGPGYSDASSDTAMITIPGAPGSVTTTPVHTTALPVLPRLHSIAYRGLVRVPIRSSTGTLLIDPTLRVLVEMSVGVRWHVVGTAPVQSGLASVHIRPPRSFRRKHVNFRVVVRGNQLPKASTTERVLVR
jgi:hypothetical protein